MVAADRPQPDKTRDRILGTSAIQFREHGYAGVSMRKIAEACGMKAGSIYYHFESKDQILSEILNIGIEKVHHAVKLALKEAPANAPASERLQQAIHAHLQALFEYSAFTSANVRIFGQVPEAVRQSNLETRRSYEELWDAFLLELKTNEDLRSEVNIRSFRLMLIGTLNATLEWFDPERGSISELSSTYHDMLTKGILVERHA